MAIDRPAARGCLLFAFDQPGREQERCPPAAACCGRGSIPARTSSALSTLGHPECQHLAGCGKHPTAGGIAIAVEQLLVDLVVRHHSEQLRPVQAIEAHRNRLCLPWLSQNIATQRIAGGIQPPSGIERSLDLNKIEKVLPYFRAILTPQS